MWKQTLLSCHIRGKKSFLATKPQQQHNFPPYCLPPTVERAVCTAKLCSGQFAGVGHHFQVNRTSDFLVKTWPVGQGTKGSFYGLPWSVVFSPPKWTLALTHSLALANMWGVVTGTGLSESLQCNQKIVLWHQYLVVIPSPYFEKYCAASFSWLLQRATVIQCMEFWTRFEYSRVQIQAHIMNHPGPLDTGKPWEGKQASIYCTLIFSVSFSWITSSSMTWPQGGTLRSPKQIQTALLIWGPSHC